MKKILIVPEAFSISVRLILSDMGLKLLGFLPVGLGFSLYTYLGKWLFVDFAAKLKEVVFGMIGTNVSEGIIYWGLVAVLTVLFYFVTQFTFLLVLSFFAAPFNEVMSRRVEKLLGSKDREIESVKKSLYSGIKNSSSILFLEIKKMFILMLIFLVSFILGLIPLLGVFSVILACLLVAIQFLDYSWIRHELGLKKILSEFKEFFFPYLIAGGIFSFILTIPLINIFSFPFAVIYFTVLRICLREKYAEQSIS